MAAAPAPTFSPPTPPPPESNSPPSPATASPPSPPRSTPSSPPTAASPPPQSTPSPPPVANSTPPPAAKSPPPPAAPTTSAPPPAAPTTSAPPPAAPTTSPTTSAPPPKTPTNNPTSPAPASPPPPPPKTPTNNPTSPAPASPPPPPPATTTSPPPPPAVAGTTPSPSPPKSFSSPPPPARILNPSPPPPKNHSSSSGNSSPPSSSGSSSNVALLAGIGAGAVIVVGFIGLLFWCLCRKPKKRQPPPSFHESRYDPVQAFSAPVGYKTDAVVSGYSLQSDQTLNRVSPSPTLSDHGSAQFWGPNRTSSMGSHGLGNSRSSFTIEELAAATNRFSAENVLGEGGFGCVYKGTLPDGRLVAVKQLKIGSGQGEREFTAEVETISRIHHRHLVSLVGYCISDNQRLLVYDFVSNGNLEHHLHGTGVPVLNWESRMKIAIGAARGLAYLHDDCHPRIIHRDIKSANILLNDNFEAQVSDFGLAKMSLDSNTHVSTRVMGTFGYLAPEYAASGKLTDRSDVFSFGVVLLELLTGRKPVDVTQPLGDESLVEWARPMLNECLDKGIIIEDLVDPKLEGKFDETGMFRLIEATAACVRHSSNRRPKMGQVLRALESTTPLSELNNGSKPGQSMIINSALQSEEIRRFRRIAFGDSSAFSTGEFTDTSSESGNAYGNSREFNGQSRDIRSREFDSGQSRDVRGREFDSGQSRDIRSREVDSRQPRQFGSGLPAFPSSLFPSNSPTSSGESETRPFNRARHNRGESTDRSSGEVAMSLRGISMYGR